MRLPSRIASEQARLAADLGPRGIRVNAISARHVKTTPARGIGDFSKVLDAVAGHSPFWRNTDPAEVADTAVFLVSDLGRRVTSDASIRSMPGSLSWACSPLPYQRPDYFSQDIGHSPTHTASTRAPARSAVEEMAEIGKRLCSVAELADQDIGIQSERGPFIVVIHAAAITAIVSRNSGAVETVRGVRMLPRHCISRSYIQSRVGNVAFVRRGRPIAKTRAELKH
ncbi:MAG: SDR family oxidoreductase [Bryobacteraceae bacterium]